MRDKVIGSVWIRVLLVIFTLSLFCGITSGQEQVNTFDRIILVDQPVNSPSLQFDSKSHKTQLNSGIVFKKATASYQDKFLSLKPNISLEQHHSLHTVAGPNLISECHPHEAYLLLDMPPPFCHI